MIILIIRNSIREEAIVSEFAPGKTYQDQVLVRVRWLWIIFPLCLLTMTFILLISTMTSSRQAKTLVWKSSVNALLQSLSYDARKELGSLECVSRVDKRSSIIDVSLERDEEGWKLLKNV
jgi:hypothetical protein